MEDDIFSTSVLCDIKSNQKVLMITRRDSMGNFFSEEVSNTQEPDKFHRLSKGWGVMDIHVPPSGDSLRS